MRFLTGIVLALAGIVSAQDETTALVNLAATRGESSKNASGFIYGMPRNYEPNDIPDEFYTDIGIKWGRAGGAQLEAPCRGWAFGFEEYKCRFEATMLNYLQTRKFDASFIILPHDIWGIDYRDTIDNHKVPGDDGDWTSYDDFLDQLISDLKASNALGGLIWDIWNEPDIVGFWGRPAQQWIDLYIRTHQRLRSDPMLAGVLIQGPSTASQPSLSNTIWTSWADQIAGNDTIPDEYTWHFGDPDVDAPGFESVLSASGLPSRPVNINEYVSQSQMASSGYVWCISRLERHNYAGLVGLWIAPLYDNFASLLTKASGDPQDEDNNDYTGAQGYPIYKYYAGEMSGQRATTTGSTNGQFDAFATIGEDGRVRIIAGTNVVAGDFTLRIEGLTEVGYGSTGTLEAQYYAFYGSDNIFQPFGDPEYLGVQTVSIEDGAASLDVSVPDKHTGWRIEFASG